MDEATIVPDHSVIGRPRMGVHRVGVGGVRDEPVEQFPALDPTPTDDRPDVRADKEVLSAVAGVRPDQPFSEQQAICAYQSSSLLQEPAPTSLVPQTTALSCGEKPLCHAKEEADNLSIHSSYLVRLQSNAPPRYLLQFFG